jgi:hypothetical protein
MNKIKEYKKLLPEELEKRIADNYKILKKIWDEDDGNSYDKYREKCRPYREDNFALYTALVLIMDRIDIDTEPLPEEDKKCLIPIKEFFCLQFFRFILLVNFLFYYFFVF